LREEGKGIQKKGEILNVRSKWATCTKEVDGLRKGDSGGKEKKLELAGRSLLIYLRRDGRQTLLYEEKGDSGERVGKSLFH